ncbi:uncharacterized protein LOC141855575 [Brevipalpus obovatus]|uniref:uncharacterized protein LOC141855575 n=1 Tax=Brevipalpus obovatus TaxID=246614 RepID=UPI003D9F16F5
MDDLDRDIIRVAEKYGIPVKRYPNCITDKRAKKLVKKGRKKKPTYRKWGNSTYMQIDDELSTSTGESCSSSDEKIETPLKADKQTKKQSSTSSSSSTSISQPTCLSTLSTNPVSPAPLDTSKSQSPKDGINTPTVQVDFIVPVSSKINQMAAVENKTSLYNVYGGVKGSQPISNDSNRASRVNETSPESTKIEISGTELSVIQSDIVCNCNRKFRTYPEYRIHKTRECELSFDSPCS